jgi:hypothetical protein
LSIISVLEAVPNRVNMLARVIASEGPMTRSELQNRIVPNAEKSDQFNNLVRETSKLQIIVEDKNISLGPEVDKKLLQDKTKFLEFCHEALVSAPLPSTDDNYTFSRALSWLLTRPVAMNTKWGAEFSSLMRDDLEGSDIYDVTNSSRSQMLGYWSHFLGYAEWLNWRGDKYLIPDPTRVITMYLPEIFKDKNKITANQFAKELGNLSVVLETGSVRSEVEGRLKTQRSDQALSTSTSLALLRLEERGKIKIEQQSDAETWLLADIAKNSRRFTHISLNIGTKK